MTDHIENTLEAPSASDAVDAVKDAAAGAADEASETVTDAAKDATSDAEDTAEDAVDAVDAASDAATDAEEGAEKATDAIQSKMDKAADGAADTFDGMTSEGAAEGEEALTALTEDQQGLLQDLSVNTVYLMGSSFIIGVLFTVFVLLVLDFMRRNSGGGDSK